MDGLPRIVCIIIGQGNGWRVLLAVACTSSLRGLGRTWSFERQKSFHGLVVSGESCQYQFIRHHRLAGRVSAL